ncbi:hypothetical protein L207DRAFT_588913 [Hyaloscypha variabilis F]|uniref:Uncharacterized protein n=1 Tax=Hyaloscypha variabilis (strain UAMH 11265 / GT02V1 / F) TaxID=1149755 RepID=A0A2J6R722_HYAVF|nr:hypothetical protein L207DRAFT_588913 [Hyaloscypha variabilis F]
MAFLVDVPLTPTKLSPTNFNLGDDSPVKTAEITTAINNKPSTVNNDETMAIEDIHDLDRLNLFEPTPDLRTKDEIIQALQVENELLKAEVKILTKENKLLLDQKEQGIKEIHNLKVKHGKKMDAMNQRLAKANQMESQLTKIHNLIGDALGIQSVGDASGLTNGSEDKDKGTDKGTKRNAEDEEEVEDMKVLFKRPRLYGLGHGLLPA